MSVTKRMDAGHAVYTKRVLAAYDFLVLGVSNKFVWQCPTQRLMNHYNRYATGNHLDVGVGTGYFLYRCRFPNSIPRIALMDRNSNALEFASRRLSRFKPEVYRQNILEPITVEAGKFDSIGLNYVLHCLPGSIETKSIAFDHLKTLMNAEAVIFGSTLLLGDVPRSWLAERVMKAYNRTGIFSNQDDDLEGLKRALTSRFRDVCVEAVGCAALFVGRV